MRPMLKRLVIALAKPLFRLIGERRMGRFLKIVADLAEVALVPVAYEQIGIVPVIGDFRKTGEFFVIDSLLPNYLGAGRVIFFDVGANDGTYTKLLCERFPDADVYAFEPNKVVCEALRSNAPRQARCFNLGLGATRGNATIYSYHSDQPRKNSEYGSVYQEVFSQLSIPDEVVGQSFEMDTLDDFCSENHISRIDFLKIDTEGHEHAVLLGAAKMLAGNQIGIIQFEFNSMNVFSRVFLKDFYSLLGNYNIYRLHPKGPIPLFKYQTKNEIFVYQNFLAIHRELRPRGGEQAVNKQ